MNAAAPARTERWRLVAALATLGLLACGGSSAPTDAGRDAKADGGGDVAQADGIDVTTGCDPEPNLAAPAPACNTLVNTAPSVAFTAEPGPVPAFAGGPLRDGLYTATRADGYADAGASGRHLTLAVLGGGTQLYFTGDILDGSAQDIEESFAADATAVASGNTLTLSFTCASVSPVPLPAAMLYTATATTLVVGSSGSGSVTTYTRQGCP